MGLFEQVGMIRVASYELRVASTFWAPDRSLGSALRFEDLRFATNLFSFQGAGAVRGKSCPPTIRAGCAFALNFRATPKSKIP